MRVISVPIKRFISEQESEVFGEVRRTFTFTVRALRLRFLVHHPMIIMGFFRSLRRLVGHASGGVRAYVVRPSVEPRLICVTVCGILL